MEHEKEFSAPEGDYKLSVVLKVPSTALYGSRMPASLPRTVGVNILTIDASPDHIQTTHVVFNYREHIFWHKNFMAASEDSFFLGKGHYVPTCHDVNQIKKSTPAVEVRKSAFYKWISHKMIIGFSNGDIVCRDLISKHTLVLNEDVSFLGNATLCSGNLQ
jgi:hypothetical protein